MGILLLAPELHYLGFKLLIQRHARVTHFFEQMEPRIFSTAMHHLRAELERVAKLVEGCARDVGAKSNEADVAKNLFAEVVRPRETVIQFSPPRAVLADEPQNTLDELYGYYVQRDFVTREYQEVVMERGLRRWLSGARIAGRFKRIELGDELYQATFPFVEELEGRPVKVIKPLHLAQSESTKIIEHSGIWALRIHQLRNRQLLPEKVLFAVQGLDTDDKKQRAYEEATDTLRSAGVTVLPYTDKENILSFAASA